MSKILQSIFKIWNFLPLFQMLFLWLNKTPLKEILLLVFKRVLIYHFEILLSPLFEHNRILIDNILWNTKFLKLVVVRSFCFGLILSPPLAWIAKNGIIRALEVLSSPLVINKWVKIIPKMKSSPFALGSYFLPKDKVLFFDAKLFSPKNGESLGATAKDELRSGSLCLCRRLQFPFNIPMTWFEIDLKTH